MPVSARPLATLSDTICAAYVRALGFRDEFDWAEQRQIEHYGPKPFAELRSELLALSKRYTYLSVDLCTLCAKASMKVDTPEFAAEVEQTRKDAKAFLKDCEAWLSDARVAIPYKLGIDGRPLGKE